MALSLNKEQDKVRLSLEKATKSTEGVTVQVVLMPDVSGSMSHQYGESGFMNVILQKTIAMSSIIDPDKVVQIIPFSNKAEELGDFGVDKFDNIWKVFQKDVDYWWGGTNYAAPFKVMMEDRQPKKKLFGLFGGKSEHVPEPTMVVFLTDGQNGGSQREFQQQMEAVLADGHTYVMAIGVGGSKRDYAHLEQLADDKDNVGFVHITDTKDLTDDKFYDMILSGEFGQWIKQF